MFRSISSRVVLAGFWAVLSLPASAMALHSDTGDRPDFGPQLAALDRDSAEPETDAADVPWSAVVRDIQRELRDLGLYNGPIDGRYGTEVKGAIERFERLHGHIGEGTPLTTALRSIVSVRDALKLRRNLDEVRERQTGEALQALRANPETRDLVDGRARAKNSNIPDAKNCGSQISVACLLADARRAAADVDQGNFHDWALREIILTEVRTGGSSDGVRDRLRQLGDPRLVLVAMREVSEALAQDGRNADALALAETIPDSENQIRALAAIAISAAKHGETRTARAQSLRVVALLKEERGLAARVAIATSLASGLAQNGDVDGATDVIRAARDFASPATASLIRRAEVGMLTGALATKGDYGEAVDALTALAEESASAMIAASASAVSRAALAEGDRYRVTTLCNLAVVQAKAGNATAAAQTVTNATAAAVRVRKGYPQDYARFSIALAWAQIGKFDEAGETLAKLDNELLRAEGFWRVAEAAALAESDSAADDFEQRALTIATKIENRFDRAIMLSDMAVAAARAHRTAASRRIFDDALSAGQGLDAGWWRARALARLATALHVVSEAETRP